MHITELNYEISKARGEDEDRSSKIIPYVASARCRHDIAALTKAGWSSEDISRGLDINLSFVRSHQARVEAENAARRKFLASGRIPEYYVPGMPTVHTIYQR